MLETAHRLMYPDAAVAMVITQQVLDSFVSCGVSNSICPSLSRRRSLQLLRQGNEDEMTEMRTAIVQPNRLRPPRSCEAWSLLKMSIQFFQINLF